jgi:hypothetical protein
LEKLVSLFQSMIAIGKERPFKEDVGELRGKRRSREHLVGPRRPGGLDA